MGIFDLFTGDPAKEAAATSRNNLLTTQGTITDRTNTTANQAAGYLNTGHGDARSNLATGYGTSTGAINTGATNALGYLNQGSTDAMGQLGQARTDLTANGGAYAPLSALATKYGAGSNLYADALGINGAGGTDRARSAYTTAPGYENQLNAGIDAVNRRANAAGMLVGGNANRDAQDYASDLANKDYGSWLDRLGGYNNLELSATSGAAAGNQANNQTLAQLGVTGANLLNTTGQNRAQIASNQGTSLSDLARNYYSQQAGLDTSQGTALGSNAWNATNTLNNLDTSTTTGVNQTYSDEAQAELTGQKNLWKLGTEAAKAVATGGTSLATSGASGASSSFLPSSSFNNNSWGW